MREPARSEDSDAAPPGPALPAPAPIPAEPGGGPADVSRLGDHGLLGAQRQALARSIGARHGNRELAAAVAQLGVARQPAPAAEPLDQLRTLLDDDQETDAIALMSTLDAGDVSTVLNSTDFKDLAVSAFDNDEMAQAVRAMHGDLEKSLDWMFEEGTDWPSVKALLTGATSGHHQVRAWMRDKFVDLCNDEEMAEAVELLQGDLTFKLEWMKAEGTSWALVKPKIVAAPDPEKAAVRNSADMRAFFVDLLGNSEMAEAVDLLAGDLEFKLNWMKAEGADWADLKAKIAGAAEPDKAKVRASADMRAFFVDTCNDKEMAEAVDLLGGDLAFKLDWMRAEGTSWGLVQPKVVAADEAQRSVIRGDVNWRAFFVDVCDNDEMGLAVQLLGGTLEWKLGWIKEEGADWQRLLQVIAGCPSDAEKAPVRASADWKAYFISECNDEQMAQVVAGLGGDLAWRLGWMRDEGSSFTLVARELKLATEPDKAVIRAGVDWRVFFVDICDNREMSEATDLLGGDLAFKLQWMAAEGADWPQLREKIALCTVEAEKAAVRGSAEMKAFFVETCSNEQMADAVTLLGGDLAFKLDWMREEGADWPRVKGLIDAAPEPERVPIRTDAWKPFFVDVCGNAEMAQAVAALGGDLMMKLAWMEAEGTEWALVKPELIACTDEAQKAAVRADIGRRDFLVTVCGDAEMAEAVDLLGGDLAFKLDWMKEEGSSWQLVREKIAAAPDQPQRQAILDDAARMAWLGELCGEAELAEAKAMLGGGGGPAAALTADGVAAMSWPDLKVALLGLHDDAKKTEIRGGGAWRDAFVSVCGNDEMAEAVDLLAGDLAFKLGWMQEEGTDFQHVKEKLRGCADDAQKAVIRAGADWKTFFVDICGNEEMAEAVGLLGGDLAFKLDWMLEEGTSNDLLLPVVTAAPQAEKTAVAANAALAARLAEVADVTVFEALGAASFVAASLIASGGADNLVQALRVIATSASVAATLVDLRAAGKFEPLLDACPVGAALPAPSKTHVDAIYAAGGHSIAERKKLVHVRYRIELSDEGIDGNAAAPWGQPDLDAVYAVLASIPDGSVLTNTEIQRLHHVVSGIGTYYPSYEAIHLPGGAGYSMVAGWPNAVVVENHFQGTIRHEMGHAIDELIGGEDWYMSDPNIDWDVFGSVGGWLESMEGLGGWGPVASDGDRDQIRTVIRSHFSDSGVNVPLVPPADPAHPFNTFAATCPIVQTAMLNQLEGAHNNFAAMPTIGNRVFTRRPVYSEFYSYTQSARNPPVWVSNYGLSAPADWFAEQVREYLRTSPPGGAVAPFVATYFRMKLP